MSQMIKLPQQEMSVDALKALIAEAEAPRPIEGQIYRHVEDAEGKRTHRRKCNGLWEYQSHRAGKWHSGLNWDEEVADGRLVPYTPPPPTFQVGQWVRPIEDSWFQNESLWSWNGLAKQVIEPPVGREHNPQMVWCQFKEPLWTSPNQLRLATPEEIAAATRIQPKVGMLLKRKSDGAVLWCFDIGMTHTYLRNLQTVEQVTTQTKGLSTEDYDILSEYTVQGVR